MLGIKNKIVKSEPLKICIAFSGGGHYIEAMKACEVILTDEGKQVFFLTYFQPNKDKFSKPCFFVTHPRHVFFIKRFFLLAANFIDSFRVYIKQKPDIVISTGADVTLSIMIIAKLFSKKVIFIESGANVSKPSMTGRIAYKFADVFIIQWSDLQIHYPNALIGTCLL